MKTRTSFLVTSLICGALMLSVVSAQVGTGGGNPSTGHFLLQPGQTTNIDIDFPASTVGSTSILLISTDPTPTVEASAWGPVALPITLDSVSYAIFMSGFNFTRAGVTVQTLSSVNALGVANFSITLPTTFPPGLQLWAQPIVIFGGGVVLTPAPVALTIIQPCWWGSSCGGGGGGGGGGTYAGPGDTVPGSGSGGGSSGQNFCNSTAGNCTMNPTNDPVGCATGAVLTTAPTVYTGYIQFGCINGNGEAGELTYGQLTAAITAAQAVGSNHIDITWGASMQLKQLYIYPIQAIQQYCLEWLAMGPSSTSCDPMQDCGQIIGTPFSIGAFNTVHGFLGNHCATNDFIRAWGTNTACVTDVSCLNGPTLSGIRLRIRVDCISGILAAITSANPGFFQSSTPVFAFAGLYCPNF